MKKIIQFVSLLVFAISNSQISEENLIQHVSFMASDKMNGRQTGSKEAFETAIYIEDFFKEYKLIPKGSDGYKQIFNAKVRRVQVQDSIREAYNVIGFLDNNANKTIVVGAHYDHLGFGELGTRDLENVGEVHNGADDNASGVAGLLELARYYATNDVKEAFNFLFIAFGAEEWGLLGSKYFVENPTIPLSDMHWMLNMDMIGRYNPDKGVAVIGYGTSSAFEEIFVDVKSDIKFYTSHNGGGGSDQVYFYRNQIPVLFFHTGGHDDYHKASDDVQKIDFKSLVSILKLEIDVIENSMKIPKMDFIKTN